MLNKRKIRKRDVEIFTASIGVHVIYRPSCGIHRVQIGRVGFVVRMKLSHCNQPLKVIDKDKGEYLCEVCKHTFFIRETVPPAEPNADLQELVGRTGCIIGLLVFAALCNLYLSLWK